MKKLIALILVVCMTASFAAAEDIDLSGLSFDQLVELKEKIILAMWNSHEWQEVKVPVGIYEVGKDIPAGKWTVRCAGDFTFLDYGNELKPGGNDIVFGCERYGNATITNPEYTRYDENKDMVEFSFSVQDGDYIKIDRSALIFTPYTGTPDLGFK